MSLIFEWNNLYVYSTNRFEIINTSKLLTNIQEMGPESNELKRVTNWYENLTISNFYSLLERKVIPPLRICSKVIQLWKWPYFKISLLGFKK